MGRTTGNYTKNDMVVFGTKSWLRGRWPSTDFRVEIFENPSTMSEIMRVGFQTGQGPVYVTQEMYGPNRPVDPDTLLNYYRLSDETITRIMLLLG